MKFIALTWSAGSLLINIIIGIYMYLRSDMPPSLPESYAYINENAAAFAGHWQAEFLIMSALFICSLKWAIETRKTSWCIIAAGLAITLFLYPVMLGGYFGTSPELMNAFNQVGTYTFALGTFLYLTGSFELFRNDTLLHSGLRKGAMVLCVFGALGFLSLFMGFISWGQIALFGPIASLIYFAHAWYGYVNYRNLKTQGQSAATTDVPVEVQVSP